MTDSPPTRKILAYFSISLILATLLGLGWILLPSSEATAAESNEWCPVLSTCATSADFQITYKNQQIRFCCNECATEFASNPEVYESRVPQLQNRSLRESIQSFLDTHGSLTICGILALTLAGLLLYRLSGKRQPAADGWMSRLLTRKIPLAYPLLILTGFLGWEVYTLREERFARHIEDEIHFATLYDFGTPPVPFRPPLKPRVKATFYRGNDERNPRLFNNGNYRTATFLVSLRNGQGEEVDHGTATGGEDLFVRLEIVRPKFTPDFLYSNKFMDKIFLTREFDKFLGRDKLVVDEIPLTTVETMQRWEALFPLGRVSAEGEASKRGLIYVCEKYYDKNYWWTDAKVRWGARYHYGIGYDLTFKDGKLTADSDLWMGCLYRTRKFAQSQLPREQWFSHEEIPLLPGENVKDPKLLGIEDYIGN